MRTLSHVACALLLALLTLFPVPANAADPAPVDIPSNTRIVYLGDSITMSGRYIAYIEAFSKSRYPKLDIEFLNLGLASETASGLTEPVHPFPRPCIHSRIDNVLKVTKPDLIVICYGMNDGIYYPQSKERFAKYKEGILNLIAKCKKTGARVVVATPPPFDPGPVMKRTQPKGKKEYGWTKPYRDYNNVLSDYAAWLRTLNGKDDLRVIQLNNPLNKLIAQRRKSDPKFRLAGDGVHPNPTGHWLIAQRYLLAAGVDATVADVTHNASQSKGPITVTFKSKLPLYMDPAWDKPAIKLIDTRNRLNIYRLTVTGATANKYNIVEGNLVIGTVTQKQMKEGIDLLNFPKLSTNVDAKQFFQLIAKRQSTLGLAWLTHAGHTRPRTRKGKPLPEAQKIAADLDLKINKLRKPRRLTLRFIPTP